MSRKGFRRGTFLVTLALIVAPCVSRAFAMRYDDWRESDNVIDRRDGPGVETPDKHDGDDWFWRPGPPDTDPNSLPNQAGYSNIDTRLPGKDGKSEDPPS